MPRNNKPKVTPLEGSRSGSAGKPAQYTHYNVGDDLQLKSKTGFIPLGPTTSQPSKPVVEKDEGPSLVEEALDPLPVPSTSQPVPPTPQVEAPPPKKVHDISNRPVAAWMDVREEFLLEFLRREGQMGHDINCCASCSGQKAYFRCMECEGDELLCKGCMVSSHKRNSLHWIMEWNGSIYELSNLKSLELVVQLGHKHGEACPTPIQPASNDFVVIHTNGIHEVSLNFCGCYGAEERHIQLLRYGWFPATTHRPQTAATLAVLKHFQIHSFESKCSALEFYQSLTRLGDNTGVRPVRDRYRAFLTMVREYRHVKSLKRAGRAQVEEGVCGTKPGECAVLCPACPQPGHNLPPDWKTQPKDKQWLYRLFLAIDANFRLKRRRVSSEEADPSLGPGWAYVVDHGPYMEHVNEFGAQLQAKSTCSSHSAVNNSRLTDGLAASGLGSVGCARHDCFRPCSVGDLQKGERYANMDYLFLLSLSSEELQELIDIIVSYDIACQWCINLLIRMKNYKQSLQVDEDKLKSFTYLVPKFHLPAHIGSCQAQYSFNFHLNVGRTDGESPERGWSHLNPLALSTCEMGPGSRRDTMDDHFGDWNYVKTIKMGLTLLKRLQTAVEEASEHTILFHRFDLGLRDKMEDSVKQWEKEVIAWEKDRSKPNPFETRVKKPTQEAVRRALAEEDRKAQKKGKAYALHTMFSGSELISVGLELEEQQRHLNADTRGLSQHPTDDQKAKLVTRGNNLHRRIAQWAEVHKLYIPCVINLSQDESLPSNMVREPWQMPLFLPSAIPQSIPCDARLQDIEWRLRCAQAHTALNELKRALRLEAYLYIDKDRFAIGQKKNTRARTLLQRAQGKITAAKDKYRTAREAISSLSKFYDELSTWKTDFPELNEEDVKSLKPEDNVNKNGRKKSNPAEGRRKVSWIWGVVTEGDTDPNNKELLDDIRVEWSKSRARSRRWKEEIQLLLEEMRRVLMFLDTEEKTWTARSLFKVKLIDALTKENKIVDEATQEGAHIYALQQAHLKYQLKTEFEKLWKGVDDMVTSKAQIEEVKGKVKGKGKQS